MRLFARLFVKIAAFAFACPAFSQDLIYTVNGKFEGENIAIDSILFENLSNGTELLFVDLPDQPDYNYKINLTRQELERPTRIDQYRIEDNFRILKNIPGQLSFSCTSNAQSRAHVSVYSIQGQKLYSSSTISLCTGVTLNIALGKDGIFIVEISTSMGSMSYMAVGSGNNSKFNVETEEQYNRRGRLKNRMNDFVSEFSFNIGDSLRVSVFRDGYYARPKSCIINASETLEFELGVSKVITYGVSDAFVILDEESKASMSYDAITGEVHFTPANDTMKIFTGEIIAIDADSTGYLRKVNKVIEEDGKLILETQQAYMNDVFVNLNFILNTALIEPVKSLNGTSSRQDIAAALTDDQGHIHPVEIIYYNRAGNTFKKSVLDHGQSSEGTASTIDCQEDISGKNLHGTAGQNTHFYISEGHVSLNSDAVFEFVFNEGATLTEDTKVKKGDLSSFKFYLDSETEFLTKLALDLSNEYNDGGERKLIDFPKSSAHFIVPPVDIWITLDPDVYGDYTISADTSLHAAWGFRSNHILRTGGSYERESDELTPITEYTSENEIYPLNLNGEINTLVLFALFPRIEIRFYELLGSFAEIVPFVGGYYNAAVQSQTIASGNENFLAWNGGIDVGLNLRIGAELPFLGVIKEFGPIPVPCFIDPLWQSPAHIELLTNLPAEVDPGSNHLLTFKVTDLLESPVDSCAVYISGDGEFSSQLIFSSDSGEATTNWIPGNETGEKTFTAEIFAADKTVISMINDTVIVVADTLKPTVITLEAAEITPTSALIGGQVTDDGGSAITETGVYWGTAANPGTTGIKKPIGSGTGLFTVTLTGLSSNTKYYIQAYAVNEAGENRGEEINFTTANETGNGIIFNPDLTYGTMTDIDGNVYKTIQIGAQVWMAENLKVTHYADGTAIPLVEDSAAWYALGYSDKAYCWYGNSTENRDIYGGLYTWAAAMNETASSNANPSGVQGVCPDGWHLPSDEEWKQLEMHMGMSQVEVDQTDSRGTDEGCKLKETGTGHWRSPNYGATNSTGFSALPGGDRYHLGAFGFMSDIAFFWTATQNDIYYAWNRVLWESSCQVSRISNGNKKNGFSVRCVED